MHFLNSLWTGVTYICAVLKSPFSDDAQQYALGLPLDHSRQFSDTIGPSFEAPSRAEDGKQAITCSYPKLRNHVPCSTPQDRGCWLKGPGMNYNIDTDYEKFYPEGTTRKYHLEITEKTIAPDGANMKGGQVFNNTYPGPWLEGCWGDVFEVTVKNLLPRNGTTIHWHGLRMLGTTEMDGVNAITQCPIAPGESMTYRFRAMQYGTTWYHSHYSLQYGVGVAGPLTIHGPSTDSWDNPIDPIMMTDWSYRSAFEDWAYSLGQTTDPRTGITTNNPRPAMKSILLNGKGQYVPTFAEYRDPTFIVNEVPKHTIYFQKGRKHLLRLINTAVDATFIFSIDNHIITVIGMDLVPIIPYRTNSVLVGIGQRYHIIVEAKPDAEAPGANYWIRTTVAEGCSSFADTRALPDERTGIVRYDVSSPYMPLSKKHVFPTACADEDYVNLRPWLKWKVDNTNPANVQTFAVGLTSGIDDPPYWPLRANISRWDMTDHPMWLNMSAPTLMNLNADYSKLPHLAVIETDINHDSWVEMIITMEKKNAPPPGSNKVFVPAAHPIHLHGHDFALLEQSRKPYNASLAKPKRDNPPRRDVVLLPRGGYIHIAFKADNPGVWLMHCHIAFHASSGLALQIIENGKHIKIPSDNQEVMNYQCKKWREWYDKNNHPDHPIQDDSAI